MLQSPDNSQKQAPVQNAYVPVKTAGAPLEQATIGRSLVIKAAWLKDQGRPFAKHAAMAKLFASEVAEKTCRDAIQVFGGYGYSQEFPVERIYRDQRLLTIGEGTSEILRVVIGRHVLGGFVGN